MSFPGLLRGRPLPRSTPLPDAATHWADAPVAPGGLLALAAWFGVLAGFAEVGLFTYRHFSFGPTAVSFIPFGPHSLWAMPLAGMLVMVAAGMVLVGLSRLWPRLASPRVLVWVFAFLACLNLTLMVHSLHAAASTLLSAGIATVAAQLVCGRAGRPDSRWRRPLRWLLGIAASRPRESSRTGALPPETIDRRRLLVGCAGVLGGSALAGREWLRHLSHAEPGPPPSRDLPNVLLIVLDTVRAASLSLHGYARRTSPNLERLAATGVCFDRAVSTAPWTLPSHASLFTGRYPKDTGVDWNRPLGLACPTLAEVLSRLGYATAGFAANALYCNRVFGVGRGFGHYEDLVPSAGLVAGSSSLYRAVTGIHAVRRALGIRDLDVRREAASINETFLAWLNDVPERPFFAFLNFFDAHAPYLPPPPFDGKFGPARPRSSLPFTGPRDRVRGHCLSQDEIRVEQDAYDGAVAYVDQQVGVLLDAIGRSGRRENTLVIVLGDHGEEFAEHGNMLHGRSLYLPSLHVPLLFSLPGRIPAGKRVRQPVSLRDVPATVLDLLEVSPADRLPGTSLAPRWQTSGETPPPPSAIISQLTNNARAPACYPISRGNMKSVIADGHHFIRNGDGREELYDVDADPWESRDVRNSREGTRIAARLGKMLEPLTVV